MGVGCVFYMYSLCEVEPYDVANMELFGTIHMIRFIII